MINMAYKKVAAKLNMPVADVERIFKTIMQVVYDKYIESDIFNFRLPYCGKIYKHIPKRKLREQDGNKKSKENNAEIHDGDYNDGTLPQ